MTFLDITLGEMLYGLGANILVFGGIATLLYSISKIIDWVWWKKENRQYLLDFRFFLRHKEEIKEYIENSAARKRGEL